MGNEQSNYVPQIVTWSNQIKKVRFVVVDSCIKLSPNTSYETFDKILQYMIAQKNIKLLNARINFRSQCSSLLEDYLKRLFGIFELIPKELWIFLLALSGLSGSILERVVPRTNENFGILFITMLIVLFSIIVFTIMVIIIIPLIAMGWSFGIIVKTLLTVTFICFFIDWYLRNLNFQKRIYQCGQLDRWKKLALESCLLKLMEKNWKNASKKFWRHYGEANSVANDLSVFFTSFANNIDSDLPSEEYLLNTIVKFLSGGTQTLYGLPKQTYKIDRNSGHGTGWDKLKYQIEIQHSEKIQSILK